MKYLITGCARSGTTLMMYLTQYFYNVQSITSMEVRPTKIKNKKSIYYIKREDCKDLFIKYPAWEIGHDYYDSLQNILDDQFKIIFMIRDGRDVLVSKHPPVTTDYHVEPKRWIFVNQEVLQYLNDERFLFVKYEDLVKDVEHIMNDISLFINKKYSDDYINFYKNVPNNDISTGLEFKGARPISQDSIGNWKLLEHYKRMRDIVGGNYIKDICDLLITFNYEKNNTWINRFK